MADMIKFFKGLEASLPTSGVNGALYITTDEGAIYLGTGTGMKRLGDFVQVDNVAALPAKAHESCLYYCVAENILAKWNGTEWKQINKQQTLEQLGGVSQTAYDTKMAALEQADTDNATAISGVDTRLQAAEEKLKSVATTEGLGDLTDRVTAAEGEIDALQAASHTHTFADSDVEDAITKKHAHTFADADVEDAISKKHAHTFVESELNKIVAGDVAKWNGVVADHLTSADKTAIEDSIGDVNTALENYKTSNNEALASVKATADAAATKEYTDAELAKKVAKTDYEADKATFATKTELGDVDKKFADYNTTDAQKEIDDAQDAEIAKKVDKVEGKSLIADSEIARLATLANYDDTQVKADIAKKADSATMTTELGKKVDKVEGYSLVSDTEIARLADVDNYDDEEVRGLIGDNAKAIEDLEAYVGTIPTDYTETNVISYINKKAEETLAAAQGGSSETAASVKQQLDNYKSENDTRVKAAEDAIDAVEGRMDTAEGKITALEGASATHAVKTEVEAALALKADKSALEATDKTLADVKTVVDNFFAEDAAVNDTIDTLKEIANYIATDKEGAADITARVGALEGKVDVDKVSEAISTAVEAEASRATGIEDGLAGRIKDIEDNKAGYATTGQVATAKQEAIDAAANDATTKANTAESNAKTYADTEIAKDRERLVALEAIDHDYAGADASLKSELEGKIASGDEATLASAKSYCDSLMTWGEF